MLEVFDGAMTLKNDKGRLSVMINGEDQVPTAIMKLDRNKSDILGLLRLMKGKENVPQNTIKFIRIALYDIERYNRQKFTKRNPKDHLVPSELIDMNEFVEQYLTTLGVITE